MKQNMGVNKEGDKSCVLLSFLLDITYKENAKISSLNEKNEDIPYFSFWTFFV